MTVSNNVRVCLASLFPLALLVLLSSVALVAQEPVLETENSDPSGALPTVPVADGDGPTGTAPVLSVFSVVKYSGRLVNADGTPKTGTVGLTFAFYADQDRGSPLWIETQNVSLDKEGRYSVLLGSQSAEGLPMEIFSSGEARWLGVYDSTGASRPRALLVTVPYAMKAAEAERLGGRSADEFVLNEELAAEVQAQIVQQLDTDEGLTLDPGLKGNPIFGIGTPGSISKFIEIDTIGDSVIFEDTATGNIGIGTSTPTTKLEVAGVVSAHNFVGSGAGMEGVARLDAPNEFSEGNSFVNLEPRNSSLVTVEGSGETVEGGSLVAILNAFNRGNGFAIKGQAPGTAVWGFSTGSTGFSAGVQGSSLADNGRGVFGRAGAETGFAVGVRGESSADRGKGVTGWARNSSGENIGVLGVTESSSGTAMSARARSSDGFTLGLVVAVASPDGQLISGHGSTGKVFTVANDGTVTATKFVGDGSMLTGIGGGGAGGDAETLDGLDSTEFARLNGGNAFTGDQSIAGAFSVATGGGGFRVIGTPTSTNILAGAATNVITAGEGATISGGGGTNNPDVDANRVTGSWGTVSGGRGNVAAAGATVSGGVRNAALSGRSVVAGGGENLASGAASSVLGGSSNIAEGDYSVVGGQSNHTVGPNSIIGAGFSNTAQGGGSFIGAGMFNRTWEDARFSFIGGGQDNTVRGNHAAILGGSDNVASGAYSAVIGGDASFASGRRSIAAGLSADARHHGAFVWNGQLEGPDFSSSAASQFSAHAPGGFRFVTATDIHGTAIGGVNVNTGADRLLSGVVDLVETFAVTNDGTVTANAFVGDGSGLTNVRTATPPNTLTYSPSFGRDMMWDNDLGLATTNIRLLRLPTGARIETLRVCGRDNDSELGNLGVRIRRKALRGGDIFATSEIIASGFSGVAFAEDANRCFDFPVDIVIDDTQFIYGIEMIIGDLTQISVAQIDYR